MDVSTSINVEINYLAVSVLSQPVWSEQSAVKSNGIYVRWRWVVELTTEH